MRKSGYVSKLSIEQQKKTSLVDCAHMTQEKQITVLLNFQDVITDKCDD